MGSPFLRFPEESGSSFAFDFSSHSSSRIVKHRRNLRSVLHSDSQVSKSDPEQTGNYQSDRIPLSFEQEAIDVIASYEQERKSYLLTQAVNDVRILINQDEFIDGEISKSETYMREAAENGQIDIVIDALMELYSGNLLDAHMLEGILSMISCIPYDLVYPKGQIMAMGLLSNKELSVRDKAIQSFERWNSKRGIDFLKSLNCHPRWLQKYVEKVMMYLERDGVD